VLKTRDATAVPSPFITEVHEFSIDRDTPVVWDTTLNPAPGGGYDPSTPLYVDVDHPEFSSPSGARVGVFYTTDGSVPTEWDSSFDGPTMIEIWPGGEAVYDVLLRMVAVDEAGNRSEIRTERYASF
jgi:hypothetical protein